MGNKIGRLHLVRLAKQKKRQQVSKPEESSGAENLAESPAKEEFPTENNAAENLPASPDEEEFPAENIAAENLPVSPSEEEFPAENIAPENWVESPEGEDFPTASLAHSWDDDNSLAERMAELSDWVESPVENPEVDAFERAKNPQSDALDKPSKGRADILQDIMAEISDPKENIPFKYLKEILDKDDRKSLDLLMKVSKELENISVSNLEWENLMELLDKEAMELLEEYMSDNPEASSGVQNITPESSFFLSVYGMDCYDLKGRKNAKNENLKFCEYVAPLLQEGLSCLNIARYNSERKLIMDITVICKEITGGVTKFILYLWDSKVDKWRLVTIPSIEMDPNRPLAAPDVRAKAIHYTNQRATNFKFQSLSQSFPSANLPSNIEKWLESETCLTAYNTFLDKKIDVTLAQGKKLEHETEFYIEWTGNKKTAYSFTVPNDAEPAGQ